MDGVLVEPIAKEDRVMIRYYRKYSVSIKSSLFHFLS